MTLQNIFAYSSHSPGVVALPWGTTIGSWTEADVDQVFRRGDTGGGEEQGESYGIHKAKSSHGGWPESTWIENHGIWAPPGSATSQLRVLDPVSKSLSASVSSSIEWEHSVGLS